ncbi:MAG: DUF4177 domain-containing protein [Desulfobulbaceae bacterium]|nr:DUF4177 domain-containing protein [Desulfobulbaceae bacterium]
MRWRYKTILFEFHKDNVFGDRYIDEEEVENTLNEQGANGWELVNVSLLREGLLAFCKKAYGNDGSVFDSGAGSENSAMKTVSIPRPSGTISSRKQQAPLRGMEREIIERSVEKRVEPKETSGDAIDDIPIR